MNIERIMEKEALELKSLKTSKNISNKCNSSWLQLNKTKKIYLQKSRFLIKTRKFIIIIIIILLCSLSSLVEYD